jgi:predicted dehydrogenase
VPTDRRYRGVIFGAGGIARTAHLPGFRATNRLDIVAAIDPSPAAGTLDGVPVFPDRAQIPERVDFIDICTPTSSHLPLALWGLDQGFHVLCEKPVALDRAQAQTLTDAAHRAGRVVMPCHQYRYNPAWRQMGAWLRAGEIGDWHLAELSVYRAGADLGAAPVPWRTTATESAGGILLDHGTHLLYSILDLAGMPTAVRAWTGQLHHRDYEVEDTAQVTLEYPARLATIFLTWASTHRENRVRFIGDRGIIDWQGGILSLERAGALPESHDFTAQLDKRTYASWFTALFTTFAAALDHGSAPTTLDDITRVATILEAAYTAARSGCRVSL